MKKLQKQTTPYSALIWSMRGELQRPIDLDLFSLEAALDSQAWSTQMFFARVWANGHPMGNSWLELNSRSVLFGKAAPKQRAPPHVLVSTGGNVYAISLQIRVCIQMQVQMHVYVLFTYIGRNEGIKE